MLIRKTYLDLETALSRNEAFTEIASMEHLPLANEKLETKRARDDVAEELQLARKVVDWLSGSVPIRNPSAATTLDIDFCLTQKKTSGIGAEPEKASKHVQSSLGTS